MLRRILSLGCACALAAFTLPSSLARAQEARVDEPIYLTVDLGVSGALNDPVEDQFEVGGGGALGLYFSLIPEVALGAQVIGGALAEGHPVPQDPVARGVGDYGLLAASLRVYPFASLMAHHTNHRAAGLYLSASPGVGIFDGEIVPGYAASAGYDFAAGPISIGPMIRFTHLIETHGRFGDNDVLMLSGGLEIAFMDEARVIAPPERELPRPAPEPVAAVAELPPLVIEPEPEPQVNDALVIDERAYFDYDEAELRPEARTELDAVIAHYRQWGDRYDRLVVSGHADERGSVEYNEALSAARALAVTNYLVSSGVPVQLLEVRAHGESDPLVPDAETAFDYQLNRRVQFDVVWNDQRRPLGVAPEPTPTMPETVDAAPARVQRNRAAWADAAPRPGVPSRAERLFEQEQQALRARIDAPVTIALSPAPTDDETIAARRVEITVGDDAAIAQR